ncbi:MAG: hypothetical protein M5U28_13660 [Sandaracinaceae bacterium]|nr:hypothetical protein [Sandaracinaceae bacterium]
MVDNPPTFTLRVGSVSLGQPRAELDVTEEGVELFVRLAGVSADTSGALIVEGTSLPLTGTIRAERRRLRAHPRPQGERGGRRRGLGRRPRRRHREPRGHLREQRDRGRLPPRRGLFRTTLGPPGGRGARHGGDERPRRAARRAHRGRRRARGAELHPRQRALPSITVLDRRRHDLARDGLPPRDARDAAHDHRHRRRERPPESRGVARLDASTMSPGFFHDGVVSLGVRLAVLNGLLHALWSSGLLDVEVTPLLPEAVRGLVSEARLTGRLPPVLRPPRAEETDDLVLSVGQLELEVVFMGAPARFAVSLDAGVTLDVAANAISVGIAETPEITVWTLVPASNPPAR